MELEKQHEEVCCQQHFPMTLLEQQLLQYRFQNCCLKIASSSWAVKISVNSKRRPRNHQPNDWMLMKLFFFFWLCFSHSICMAKNRASSCLLFHWSISWQLLCNKSWKYLSGLSWTKDDLLLPIWPSHQALIRCKWQISKWTCHWL